MQPTMMPRASPHNELGLSAEELHRRLEYFGATAIAPSPPAKLIISNPQLMTTFRESAAFAKILYYTESCAESVRGIGYSRRWRSRPTNPSVKYIVQTLFPAIHAIIDRIPLHDAKMQRFGNPAKREFHTELEAELGEHMRALVRTFPPVPVVMEFPPAGGVSSPASEDARQSGAPPHSFPHPVSHAVNRATDSTGVPPLSSGRRGGAEDSTTGMGLVSTPVYTSAPLYMARPSPPICSSPSHGGLLFSDLHGTAEVVGKGNEEGNTTAGVAMPPLSASAPSHSIPSALGGGNTKSGGVSGGGLPPILGQGRVSGEMRHNASIPSTLSSHSLSVQNSNHFIGESPVHPPHADTATRPRTQEEIDALANELGEYIKDSFGNARRLDYGSGHELHFFIFIMICLEEHRDLGGLVDTTRSLQEALRLTIPCPPPVPEALADEVYRRRQEFILYVFRDYLSLMRRIQTHYKLEPAGSHGVWGLDDYHHLPYVFGAAQLVRFDAPVYPNGMDRSGVTSQSSGRASSLRASTGSARGLSQMTGAPPSTVMEPDQLNPPVTRAPRVVYGGSVKPMSSNSISAESGSSPTTAMPAPPAPPLPPALPTSGSTATSCSAPLPASTTSTAAAGSRKRDGLSLLEIISPVTAQPDPVNNNSPNRFSLKGQTFLPADVCQPSKVTLFQEEYFYPNMIYWINIHKRGPFHEHSNMLYNISSVATWEKTFTGMMKMFAAEVLGKFTVVQHLLFGAHLAWNTATLYENPSVKSIELP